MGRDSEFSLGLGFTRLRRAGAFVGALILIFNAAAAHAVEAIRPAPHCDLTHWISGAALDLADLRGKVVYLDFWASWCTSCVESFPFLNQLERDYSARGLVVLGINLDEQRADAARFLVKHPVQFAVAANPNMLCPKTFGVPGMPAAYVIDRTGNIRHEHLGFRPGQADALRGVVEQLLSE